ncbi:MAG: hypothetical protein FWE07_00690 [Turicibacter sp.]|nr:hypothetical protein [Turicibacter sp.]
MRLKRTLKYMGQLFCVVTTAQVVFISALATISGTQAEIDYRILPAIMVTTFVGVLPTIMFVIGTENVSRKIYYLLVGIHFVLTTSFVFLSLNHFETFHRNNTIPVFLFFIAIYLTAHITAEMRTKKTIDELNKRINATHQD